MMKYFPILGLLMIRSSVVAEECDSNRPNSWADHRTLRVPSSAFLSSSGNGVEEAWTNALCCVYTHVEKDDNNNGSEDRAELELYDGSSYTMSGTSGKSFVDIAQDALSDICDMGMGEDDCRRQEECMQEALNALLPTCDQDRPNSWATHRTLKVPHTLVRGGVLAKEEIFWHSTAMCCVYTYVEIVMVDDTDTAELELYDGSSYNIRGDTFEAILEKAMDDICDMGMGSEDCDNQKKCVEDAMDAMIELTDSSASTGPACFPGDTLVQVKDGTASKMMKDLKIGDFVLTDNEGAYHQVYSFGHFDPTAKADFIELSFSGGALQVSRNHLLFAGDDATVTSAGSLKVGDSLLVHSGSNEAGKITTPVTSITTISRRDGLYAPFTTSGSIVVNGVVASNYVNLDEFVKGLPRSLNLQWILHACLAPHRLICRFVKDCVAETYTSEGISKRVDLLYRATKWFFSNEQNFTTVGTALVLVPVIAVWGLAILVENFVNALTVDLFVLMVLVSALGLYFAKTKFRVLALKKKVN